MKDRGSEWKHYLRGRARQGQQWKPPLRSEEKQLRASAALQLALPHLDKGHNSRSQEGQAQKQSKAVGSMWPGDGQEMASRAHPLVAGCVKETSEPGNMDRSRLVD